ncbi:DUF2254 domain-containing protein [Hafnia psychrotolerans]|uniref:DUF2254 domain-containing protein n=1 Tax=Hafnia psychrotolerans TaxID=1477018 RepID=A0ABQ1H2W2_9GAMM|nr:DUF2254 domain-containing protein [Hafnia psychrotolerans]GGA55961.1 hypothetical protein GCM10011328_34240 [Hafnia psychrotolerans]
MTSKWHWLLGRFTRKLWFRTSLFAILAVATALLSISIKSFIPPSLSGLVGSEAVDKLLGILASSMLAVTTFSLNIMVSAYNAASSSVTPRATKLLVEDSTTQNVLATFIGSFVFSLVGIIALSMGAYGEQGRVVLFIVTLAVILLIVLTLLRWIQHLSHFGRMEETTRRVEEATQDALVQRIEEPYLGGRHWDEQDISTLNAWPVYAKDIGYVQHVDMKLLSECAQQSSSIFFVASMPGAFVHLATPILWIQPIPKEPDTDPLMRAFTISTERSFDQDPRFGFCVLSEIASRALSPAVNDPGTAIDVIGRAVRLLSYWKVNECVSSRDISFPHVYVRPIETRDLFDDIFTPIARDGASLIEVQVRLQKALHALAQMDPSAFGINARRHSLLALARAGQQLKLADDMQYLKQIAVNDTYNQRVLPSDVKPFLT